MIIYILKIIIIDILIIVYYIYFLMSNFKINILEILYCELSDIQVKNSIKYIVKKIIYNDNYFYLYKNNINFISELCYIIIESFCLRYLNASFGNYIFNIVQIDLNSKELISKNKIKLFIFMIIRIIISYIKNYLLKKNFNPFLFKIPNIIYKFIYLLNKNFPYSNIINNIFGIISVRKYKENNSIIKIIFFILYLILKYSNSTFEDKKIYFNIPPPENNCPNNLKGKCFICKKPFLNPVVMKCCGYIFCSNCIYNNNSLNKKCISCKNPILKNSIIKLYP